MMLCEVWKLKCHQFGRACKDNKLLFSRRENTKRSKFLNNLTYKISEKNIFNFFWDYRVLTVRTFFDKLKINII